MCDKVALWLDGVNAWAAGTEGCGGSHRTGRIGGIVGISLAIARSAHPADRGKGGNVCQRVFGGKLAWSFVVRFADLRREGSLRLTPELEDALWRLRGSGSPSAHVCSLASTQPIPITPPSSPPIPIRPPTAPPRGPMLVEITGVNPPSGYYKSGALIVGADGYLPFDTHGYLLGGYEGLTRYSGSFVMVPPGSQGIANSSGPTLTSENSWPSYPAVSAPAHGRLFHRR